MEKLRIAQINSRVDSHDLIWFPVPETRSKDCEGIRFP